ncbi:MAG: NAD(P)/FAD-dependent oxidoreductase, partial [Synergistaceae bacterium]|nr:NAD(P)/FAD-dependent oxidoreductase [Synergistaceae bacterium]
MGKVYDAIIVGAGPAGLFAALELSRGGAEVLILDKGRDIDKRFCPLKSGAAECAHCQPCNVVCGWGGAGSFSDGKLTLTPEFGGNMEQYCGRAELISLIEEVDRDYLEHGASPILFKPEGELASRIIDRARRAGLDVLPATIRHMGTDKSKDILRSLYLQAKDKCDIRLDTAARSVTLGPGGAVAGVRLDDGTELGAKNVLLAPGREGAPWMEETIRELG